MNSHLLCWASDQKQPKWLSHQAPPQLHTGCCYDLVDQKKMLFKLDCIIGIQYSR